ncbi:hypothetical protein HDV04_004511 [Boothiomyces sp. JEL0838]|nr:hypothetical protein HDV04_004511 [Boothiomyces sp. JEL0838]
MNSSNQTFNYAPTDYRSFHDGFDTHKDFILNNGVLLPNTESHIFRGNKRMKTNRLFGEQTNITVMMPKVVDPSFFKLSFQWAESGELAVKDKLSSSGFLDEYQFFHSSVELDGDYEFSADQVSIELSYNGHKEIKVGSFQTDQEGLDMFMNQTLYSNMDLINPKNVDLNFNGSALIKFTDRRSAFYNGTFNLFNANLTGTINPVLHNYTFTGVKDFQLTGGKAGGWGSSDWYEYKASFNAEHVHGIQIRKECSKSLDINGTLCDVKDLMSSCFQMQFMNINGDLTGHYSFNGLGGLLSTSDLFVLSGMFREKDVTVYSFEMDEISGLYNKSSLELPTLELKEIKQISFLDQAKEAYESLQLQIDCLLPLLQESKIIPYQQVKKPVENTPKKVSFKEQEFNIESLGLSSLGMELISDRFSSNSISTFYSDSEAKLEPEYNLLDSKTRAKISLNYFNETVQEINELLEDKKFLGKQDGFTIEELQESSKQKTGKKTSEFEIGNVVICEWIQTFNSDWLIYCTKDTVYLRLNQSLLIREIKIQAKKVDLFDNNLIVINDKIHFYNLKDLDFYLIFSKKKLVLDNQVHSIKSLISKFQTEMKLYEKQTLLLNDKLPIKTKLDWKKQYLYGQTKLDQKMYLPIQRNITSINQKILSIITEIMDQYFEIKSTVAEMNSLTRLKKIDYKPLLTFEHDFINIKKSIKGKSNFLLYLAQNEIVEPDSWFLEYDKTVAFSLSEYNLKTDNESIITCINGTVYSFDKQLYMTSLAGVETIQIDNVVSLDWYNGPVILTDDGIYYYDGELCKVMDMTDGIHLEINQTKNVLFVLKKDYTLELYDIEQ